MEQKCGTPVPRLRHHPVASRSSRESHQRRPPDEQLVELEVERQRSTAEEQRFSNHVDIIGIQPNVVLLG